MVEFLNEKNIIAPRQYGFRKGHSTTDTVFNLVGEILKSFEKDMMVLSVFIDLRKAFDTVSFDILLRKLEKLGVSNTELQWFASYLIGKKQVTKINSCTSQLLDIKVGNPTGKFAFHTSISNFYQ